MLKTLTCFFAREGSFYLYYLSAVWFTQFNSFHIESHFMQKQDSVFEVSAFASRASRQEFLNFSLTVQFHDCVTSQVGVFGSLESEEYTNFLTVADKLRLEYAFTHTLDPSYLPEEIGGPTAAPAVRIYKPFDDGSNDATVIL